jgi:hypothetical protein
VWESTINGRKLTFHLAGINNQNFIMRDDETGSWWQQVSGEAIQGPLKGQRLNLVFHDEISFSTWRQEKPAGRVLRPDAKTAALYEDKDWEAGIARMPVVTPAQVNEPLKPRELIIGIRLNQEAKAYPLAELQKQAMVLDTLGQTPLFLVLDADKKSARAFERTVDGRVLEFFAKAGASPLRLIDAETGSEWDFSGKAVSGPLKDKQLKKIYVLSDYWFDWRTYNPNTSVYGK